MQFQITWLLVYPLTKEKKNKWSGHDESWKSDCNLRVRERWEKKKTDRSRNRTLAFSFITTSYYDAPTIWAKSSDVKIVVFFSICIDVGVIIQDDWSLFILIWTQKFNFIHVLCTINHGHLLITNKIPVF